MDSPIVILALRLIHIVAGVLWVGAIVLMAAFVFPTVQTLGPQGGRFMQELMQRRKTPVYIGAAGGLTILSGLLLYWRAGAATDWAWAATRPAMVFGFGGVMTILAMIVGGAVMGRASRRLGVLGQAVQASGGPPSAEQAAEMEALQRRIGFGMRIVAVLLVIAASAMAIARYLG